MIIYRLISVFFCLLVALQACDEKVASPSGCMQFEYGLPFEAKIGQSWCDDEGDFILTPGPILEDSRCNVPGIECFWAGRFVMAATFQNEGLSKDTFYAVNDWRDTLYVSDRAIILDKVFPETRTDMGVVDTGAYSFRLIIRKQ